MDGMVIIVHRSSKSTFVANNCNFDENAEDDFDCSLPPDCFSQPSPTCLIRKFDMSCSLTNNSSPVPNSFSRMNTNKVIQFLKEMQINTQILRQFRLVDVTVFREF